MRHSVYQFIVFLPRGTVYSMACAVAWCLSVCYPSVTYMNLIYMCHYACLSASVCTFVIVGQTAELIRTKLGTRIYLDPGIGQCEGQSAEDVRIEVPRGTEAEQVL